MFRPSKWFGWNRSPNSADNGPNSDADTTHSLDQLKVLYNLLEKNQTVSDSNRRLLVETLRQIAEILIWGDQNDSSVFDFFLEKNMLEFFLQIMRQKCGGFVCTQLLQTLNILFENIRNETSLYYLLSNNHVNSIIVHKFDFNDEEVMAYYISFLKTLSLKLNNHTIHFFFNEQTADFPLYTEAIKFFNHPEKMVKIAVRTLTLNVFRVREEAMLKFIGDCTAAPYFSNLTWFIGNHVLEVEQSLSQYVNKRTSGGIPNSFSHQNLVVKLEHLVAEHLDHLHYLNDILHLDIDDLNSVLCKSLVHKFIIPLYLHSFLSIVMDKGCSESGKNDQSHSDPSSNNCSNSATTHRQDSLSSSDFVPPLSPPVALFLLTQAFIIFSYPPLLNQLIDFIFLSNQSTIDSNAKNCEFTPPERPLDEAIEQAINDVTNTALRLQADKNLDKNSDKNSDKNPLPAVCNQNHHSSDGDSVQRWNELPFLVTLLSALNSSVDDHSSLSSLSNLNNSSYLINDTYTSDKKPDELAANLVASCHSPAITKWIVDTKSQDDRVILFTLSVIVSILNNRSISTESLSGILIPRYEFCQNPEQYSESFCVSLVNTLLYIIRQSCSLSSPIRVITFELAVYLFKRIVFFHIENSGSAHPPAIFLSDHHLALLEQSCEDCSHILKRLYNSTEKTVFLDIFEQEAELSTMFQKHKVSQSRDGSPKKIWSQNVNMSMEQLFNDSSLLLPCNIANNNSFEASSLYLRLPINEYERIRRFVKVFFVLRRLSFEVRGATAVEVTEDVEGFNKRHTDAIGALLTPSDANAPKIDELIDLDNCDLNQCTLSIYYLLNPSRFEMGYDWRENSMNSNRRWAASVPGSRSDSPSNLPRKRLTRFIVISATHIVVIEPDSKHYNNGRVRFIARLQDLEIWNHSQAVTLSTNPDVRKDREDNKSFFLLLRRYRASNSMFDSALYRQNPSILIRCIFEDTIRYYAAKQHLTKAQNKIRDTKVEAVKQLIDLYGDDKEFSGGDTQLSNGQQGRGNRPQSGNPRMGAFPGGAVLSNNAPDAVNTSIVSRMFPGSARPKTTPNSGEKCQRKKLKNQKELLGDDQQSIPMNDLSPKLMRKVATPLAEESPEGRDQPRETCVDQAQSPKRSNARGRANSEIIDV